MKNFNQNKKRFVSPAIVMTLIGLAFVTFLVLFVETVGKKKPLHGQNTNVQASQSSVTADLIQSVPGDFIVFSNRKLFSISENKQEHGFVLREPCSHYERVMQSAEKISADVYKVIPFGSAEYPSVANWFIRCNSTYGQG